MPLTIRNKSDGKKIHDAIAEGKFADDPEKEAEAQRALSIFVQRMKRVRAAPVKDASQTEAGKETLSVAGDIARNTTGVLGVAATIANSAIAEPLAGISGLAAGLAGLVKGDGFSG